MESQSNNQIDTRQLAIGVLYLNLRKAVPDFPGSTRSHPAVWVYVNLTCGNSNIKFSEYFPFKVIWYIWEQVVLPVLEDPNYQVVTRTGNLRNNINQQYLDDGNYDALLDRIESGIVSKLQETGELPGGTEEAETPVEETPEVDPARWPEGHPRLTYPIVD